MRLIDADALYERLRDDEDLARQRVIDTPNSFPNGMLNPAAVRYMAQLNERTRFKEIVYDAPTIEPERKTGKWIHTDTQAGYDINGDLVWADMMKCETCGFEIDVIQGHIAQYNFCPNCGAKMEGESD